MGYENNIGRTPDQAPNRYAQIRELVNVSIFGQPKRARLAQRDLLQTIRDSEDFDPSLIASARLLEIAVQRQKTIGHKLPADVIKPSMGLLTDILNPIFSEKNAQDQKPITLMVNPRTLDAVASIVKSSNIIERNESLFINKGLPAAYKKLVNLAPKIQKAGLGVYLTIVLYDSSKGEPPIMSSDSFIEWENNVIRTLKSNGGDETGKSDRLIDLLKSEPEDKKAGREKLYSRKYANTSLADIEQMQYPLSEGDFDQITDFYLLAIDDKDVTRKNDRLILYTLFSKQVALNDYSQLLPARNKELIAILNNWQEHFLNELLYGDNRERLEKIKSIISQGAVKVGNMMIYIPYYLGGNPTIAGKWEEITGNPLVHRYLKAFSNRKGSLSNPDSYLDEIGLDYLQNTALPLVKTRLQGLGISEEEINKITVPVEQFLVENPFAKQHLEVIQSAFERNAGHEFLEKLNGNTSEMEEIILRARKKIEQIDIQYLPLSQGSDIIEFSANSLPNLLGLQSIELTMPDHQKPEVSVKFHFKNLSFILVGGINLNDAASALRFKAQLQESNPGLYTILNLITTLSIRDLVTQAIQDKDPQKTKRRIQQPEQPSQELHDTEDIEETKHKSIRRGGIRTQKDKDVINAISKHGKFTPRRVNLYKRAVAGAQAYYDTINEYLTALSPINKGDEAELTALEQKIDEARANLRRTSEEKKKKLPLAFELASTEDPLTMDEFDLETWVVEHTSPKPTSEELNSPSLLFIKYYEDSSALSFLDQMLPWFLGQ